MARFFFHFRGADQSITDCQGIDVADVGVARDEARRIAADFMDRSTGEPCAKWQGWRVEVSDSRGRGVFSLPLEDLGTGGSVAAGMPRSQPQRIVHLDVVRNARAVVALRNDSRELIRRAAILRDEHRYIRRRFDVEMRQAREAADRSQELLAAAKRASKR